ncbi:helix-turn-helix domain-containing protein [Tardiphaga sp. vice278]|nr:helix-turn-helix domain-containing protein [Tardiphaga sp. vice278]
MALLFPDLPALSSPDQVAKATGLKPRQVRSLIQSGRLGHIKIGSRVVVPRDAIEQFISMNTVQTCRDETQVPASVFLKNASASISSGPMADAAASAQRALRTANLLNPRSPTSSTSARGTPARVIPLRSS